MPAVHPPFMTQNANLLRDRSGAMLVIAREFGEAASRRGCAEAIPEAIGRMEEVLRILSRSWIELGVDAVPEVIERRAGARVVGGPLSREQESRLLTALHDAASELNRAARVCRGARTVVSPLIASRIDAERRSIAR